MDKGKSETVRARVNPALKHAAEGVFEKLGLTMSEAIVIFLSQVRLNRGLPFDVRIPNRVTRKTFSDTDKGKNLVHYDDTDEMFDDLGT